MAARTFQRAPVLLALFAAASSAHAFDAAPATLDDWVLRPDIWAAGTVTNIDIKALDGTPQSVAYGLVRIRLEGVRILASRISVPTPLEILAVGAAAEDGTSGAVIRHVNLVTGSTYLFSLQGGAWSVAPFVHDPMEVDADGVHCAGSARIYGFGAMGPVCGTSRTIYGQPMTLSAFEAGLLRRRGEAARRWANWANSLDDEAEPLAFAPANLPTTDDGNDVVQPISEPTNQLSDGGSL